MEEETMSVKDLRNELRAVISILLVFTLLVVVLLLAVCENQRAIENYKKEYADSSKRIELGLSQGRRDMGNLVLNIMPSAFIGGKTGLNKKKW